MDGRGLSIHPRIIIFYENQISDGRNRFIQVSDVGNRVFHWKNPVINLQEVFFFLENWFSDVRDGVMHGKTSI